MTKTEYIITKLKRIMYGVLIFAIFFIITLLLKKDVVNSMGIVFCMLTILILYSSISKNVNSYGSLFLMNILLGVLSVLIGSIVFGVVVIIPLTIILTITSIKNKMDIQKT